MGRQIDSAGVGQPGAERAYLGAFGKHPGWNDHLDDQGLETDRLVQIKRVLYVEGIGGNIDAGSWASLEPEQRIEGFDHVFVWRDGLGVVVGRIWSSTDGKGRSRYPMIVCAELLGVDLGWAVRTAVPMLDRIKAECCAVETAEGVVEILDRERAQLCEQVASQSVSEVELVVQPQAFAQKADHRDMGGDGGGGGGEFEAMARVVHQVQRELGAYLVEGEAERGVRTRMIEAGPRHMRVPRCADDVGLACVGWLGFLLERLDHGVPMLCLARLDRGWVDLVLGEPRIAQFYCVRTETGASPLTTEIPYTIDEELAASVEKMALASRKGEGIATRVFYLQSQSGGQKRTSRFTWKGRGFPGWLMYVVVGLLGLIMLVTVLSLFKKSPDAEDSVEPQQADSGQVEGDDGAGGGGDGQQEVLVTKQGDSEATLPRGEGNEIKDVPEKVIENVLPEKDEPVKEVLVLDPDPRLSWGWEGAVASLEKLSDELGRGDAEKAQGVRGQIRLLRAEVQTVLGVPGLETQRQHIADQMAQVDVRINELSSELTERIAAAGASIDELLANQPAKLGFSAAINLAWTEKRGEIVSAGGGAAQVRHGIDALREFLESLDEAIGAVEFEAEGEGGVGGAIADRLALKGESDREARIERAIKAVGWDKGVPDSGDPAFSARLSENVNGREMFVRELTRVGHVAEQVLEAIRMGSGLSDVVGDDGETLSVAWDAVRFSEFFDEIREELEPAAEQMVELESIAQLGSVSEVFEKANALKQDDVGLLRACWGRAFELAEGEGFESLSGYEDLLGKVTTSLALVSVSEKAGIFEQELGEESQQVWQVFFQQAETVDALDRAVGAMEAFGVEQADLAGAIGVDVLLTRLRLVADQMDETLLRVKVGEVAGAIRGVEGKTDEVLAVALEGLLSEETVEELVLDVAGVGPGLAGWAGRIEGDGERLVYGHELGSGKRFELGFRRVESEGGVISYVCESELSLGLFISAVDSAGIWQQVSSVLAQSQPGIAEPRRGVRGWSWANFGGADQRMRVADGWQSFVANASIPEAYPAGMEVGGPGLDSPVQWISPEAAAMVAGVLGCRLMTVGEWQAIASGRDKQGENLCDGVVGELRDYVQTVVADRWSRDYPDARIARDRKLGLPRGEAMMVGDLDDGVLWFAPVDMAGGSFEHVLGNVAEYATRVPVEFGEVGADVQGVKDQIRSVVVVVGGSALSPPDRPMDAVVTVGKRAKGYADVGVRLAFSAEGAVLPQPGLGEQVQSVLMGRPRMKQE